MRLLVVSQVQPKSTYFLIMTLLEKFTFLVPREPKRLLFLMTSSNMRISFNLTFPNKISRYILQFSLPGNLVFFHPKSSHVQKRSLTKPTKPTLFRNKWSRVSVQGVKSLGSHFACLCRGSEFYEVKKNNCCYFSKRK